MKHKHPISVIFTILITLPSVLAGNEFQQTKDSLLQVIAAQSGEQKLNSYSKLAKIIYFHEENADSALTCFAGYQTEAHRQGNARQETQARAITLNFLSNRHDLDKFRMRVEDDLTFARKHKIWDKYFAMSSTKFMIYLNNGQNGEALEMAQKLYKEAKTISGFPSGEAYALSFLGYVYKHTNRYQDAIDNFKKAIEVDKNCDNLQGVIFHSYYELNALYATLLNIPEGEKTLAEWKNAIEFSEKKHGNSPILWQQYYNGAIYNADLKKEYDKVEEYIERLEKIGANNKALLDNMVFSRVELYVHKGDWQKALKYALQGLEMESTPIFLQEEYHKFLIEIYAHLRMPEQTKAAMNAAFSLNDSIKKAEFNAQLDELRTVYEVDKITAEKEKTRNFLIFALAGCLLLAVALGIWICLHRQIARKNQSLYIQIQELLQKEKAAGQQLLAVPEEKLSRAMQLFRSLSELMQNEKLFTSPDLNRKKLADRLGTNEIYLADAIREATGTVFSTYLSDLRLQYTLELMSEQPGLTLNAIAIDSGIGSYSAFLRLFSKKYGITPSEYRRLAAAKI